MNINSIKPGSSTLLVLNYLGMRKRCKNQWTTAAQVADFFPHVFRKRGEQRGSSDAQTVLKRLVDSSFLISKDTDDGKVYGITSAGSEVPFRVAQRLRNSPYYFNKIEED